MDNHPVPQNISSYEFHLVGDMTLKQFLYLAAGLVVGFVFFRLQIIAIIKIPLALLSVLIGVLMAFVPINGRPFSAWLTAFVKAIYSPTVFVWVPDEMVAAATPQPQPAPPPAAPQVAVLPVQPVVKPDTSIPAPTVPQVKPATPEATKILPSFSDFLSSKNAQDKLTYAKETTVSRITEIPPSPQPQTPPPQQPAPTISPSTQVESPVPVIRPGISIPEPLTSNTPVFVAASQMPKNAPVASAPSASVASQISPPTQPNILSGLIVDPANLPLPQITVEVIDVSTGIPARALRTNKLGQFQIAIPLPAGNYNIAAEKDGFKFEPVSIQVKGNIIPPVIIQAQKV